MSHAFTAFVAEHSIALDTVDPDAAFDDLEPLADTFSAARVIAIGENAHGISEFYQLRHRLLRFLVQRCGFRVFAMESGFSEGLAVDAWIRGGPGDLQDIADNAITYTMGRCPQMRAQLHWMRHTNTTEVTPVRFFGLDVPGSTASPLLAIDHIGHYLNTVDPDAAPVIDRLVALINQYATEHAPTAFAAYGQLNRDDRNEITVLLAELAAWFDTSQVAYRHTTDAVSFHTARHELRLVTLLDQALRGYAAQGDRETAHPRVAASARDRGIAETVLWLLNQLGPDTKIVVGAHNSHIQRTPVATPHFALPQAGHHLADQLDNDYLTIAVTCTAGRTTTYRPNPDTPGGIQIIGADLTPPRESSVEAAFTTLRTPRIVDLRPARGHLNGPDQIRVTTDYQQATPILDAYDLVINIPETTTTTQAGE